MVNVQYILIVLLNQKSASSEITLASSTEKKDTILS